MAAAKYPLRMLAIRLATVILLATIATSQPFAVPQLETPKPGLSEPGLPVIYTHACPFEGCTFREWTVKRKSQAYSSWQDTRREVATLEAGEEVTGITGVLVIRKPDRFLVKQPIPYFSLNLGDVILQYAEWGEGFADLWTNGVWHKDFDWSQTADGDVILANSGFVSNVILRDDNITLVQQGNKEWWVQVRRMDGQTGWVLADANFDGMDKLSDGPAEQAADSERGSLCVAPNPSEPPSRFSPGQFYNPATLFLKLDKKEAIPWPHKDGIQIDVLGLKQRHLFVVISDGKPLQSFWFRFTEFRSRELCVSFDGYQGVQVQEKKRSPWCKCK